MKIDVICNDGSPLGTHLRDLYGDDNRVGVGGAELALHTMCEAWHKQGYSVRLYNNPTHPHGSPYEQYSVNMFDPNDNRDILIIFRSPNHRITNAKGLKIWWSTDQYTIGNFRDFAKQVDKIITISNFHSNYFLERYGIENTITIDLPVRTSDYTNYVEKVPNRLIFCSVPDRGLDELAQIYPMIKKEIPELSLTITSDYRLWGVPNARNERFISKFLGMDGVKFMGAIKRKEMVKEQLLAQVQAYPCTYEELFCYSVAECQIAGAYPITSIIGALQTTNMGTQIGGDVHGREWKNLFAEKVIETLLDKALPEKQNDVIQMARSRFSLDKILDKWETVFENG